MKYPFKVLYSSIYKNVSGQSLMIDGVRVAPNSTFWHVGKDQFLTTEQYTSRGILTQNLIDQGYIQPVYLQPVIPNGYLYMQSWEHIIEDNKIVYPWFRVWSVEKYENDEFIGYSWDLERVEEPDKEYIIDYSLAIPHDTPVLTSVVDKIPNSTEFINVYGKLSEKLMATRFDFTFNNEHLYHEKVNPIDDYCEITKPLAISNESLFLIKGNILASPETVFLTTKGITAFVKIAPSTDGVMFAESVSFEVDRRKKDY